MFEELKDAAKRAEGGGGFLPAVRILGTTRLCSSVFTGSIRSNVATHVTDQIHLNVNSLPLSLLNLSPRNSSL